MNSMKISSVTSNSEFLDAVWSTIVSTQVELVLFFVAMGVYVVLFQNRQPTKKKSIGKDPKSKINHEEPMGAPAPTPKESKFQSFEELEKSMQRAIESGDYRMVVRCWTSLKQYEQFPMAHLAPVVEAMQRLKKGDEFVVRELKGFFRKRAEECNMAVFNDLLEGLSRWLDSSLMNSVVGMLPSLGLKKDQRTYEIFLKMYLTTRSFEEVESLVQEMNASGVPPTVSGMLIATKAFLRMGNLSKAMEHFHMLRNLWTKDASLTASPSSAPHNLVAQVVELMCKEHAMARYLSELEGLPVPEESMNAMLSECIRVKDCGLAMTLQGFARTQDAPPSDVTYGLLVRALAGSPSQAKALIEEVLERKGADCSSDFVTSALAFCAKVSDLQLADALYERLAPTHANILNAFVHFYADSRELAKACDIFESNRPLRIDSRVERSLLNAALRCGRTSLAKELLESSPSDIAKHITMIRNCSSEGNLQCAKDVFGSLKNSGVELNSIIYNTVLDACVNCQDLKAAEEWMQQTKEAGMADVVSFNTLIKAYLQRNKLDKARRLMEDMKQAGLQPNRVTYNELINASVAVGGCRGEIWAIVKEMKDAGISANQVTCSILLKSLNARSPEADVKLTMEMIDSMEEPMDEVLLSSVVEACVRIGKPDLLSQKLKQLQDDERVTVTGSHTFGSLIKAYGHAGDLDGAWRCWKDMRSRHVKPTSITLGCMIEAVVSNGDCEGAYELLHQMSEDDQCKPIINSVVYCSVLKGFARERKLERIWAVYDEMKQKQVELTIVTFNTILDACARAGRMEHLPKIMDDMKAKSISPNIVTYSTMIKGHCQSGDVHAGFALMEQMKCESNLKPDEIMYNSLLDGCAQQNLLENGLRVLSDMQAEGVQPSNFTLSVLVKLLNRTRKVDQAFSMVEEISKKYRFQPNVHVYTNLIQACVSNRQLPRALETLEAMLRQRVAPEGRTYTILVKASMSQGQYKQAVGLLRGALGLADALGIVQESLATCRNLDQSLVCDALDSLVDAGFRQDLAVPLFSDIVKFCKHKVRVDSGTQRRVMGEGGERKVGGGIGANRAPWRSRK